MNRYAVVTSLLACLAVGAGVTVAVAWWCVLRGPVPPLPPPVQVRAELRAGTERTSWTTGVRVGGLERMQTSTRATRREAGSFVWSTFTTTCEMSAGWPWLSLTRSWTDGVPSRGIWAEGIRTPAAVVRRPPRWEREFLPIRPRWGFAACTAFYGGGLWGALFGFATGRRLVRLLSRRCVACGYPIGPGPRCTECGRPVPGVARGGTLPGTDGGTP